MFSYSIKDFMDFLDGANSPYHAVEEMKKRLLCEGFVELFEYEPWNLFDGGKYFVIRHSSSLIACHSSAEISRGSKRGSNAGLQCIAA